MNHFSNKNQRGNQNRDHGSGGGERQARRTELENRARGFTPSFDITWILLQMDQHATDHAFHFALALKEGGLTRTQVRNFFGELRRIEARGVIANVDAVFHLQHKLSYTKTRLTEDKSDKGVNPVVAEAFHDVLMKGLKAIGNDKATMQVHFERFTAYFEAVLAYHRFHGGRES
jgi:CRISPR-associated protein Csm2